MKISILGAGSVGFAFAGYLGVSGYNVCLYEDSSFEKGIKDVKKHEGIHVTGAVEGFGEINHVTTSIEEAVKHAEVIVIAVPANAHRVMAEACAPYLEEGQIILISPSKPFAAYEFATTIKEVGNTNRIYIAESSNIFACRKGETNDVNIVGMREHIEIAALRSSDTDYVVQKIEKFLPGIERSELLEITLNDIGILVHPAPAVLNAGWIESTEGNFDFYWEGMSPAVCNILEKIDEERVAVGKALGLDLPTIFDYMQTEKAKENATLHELIRSNELLGGPKIGTLVCPKHLEYRYITEDVPFGLVPFSEIGQVINIQTKYMDMIISLASAMNKVDYRKNGRNLTRMGIQATSLDELKREIIK